ncbi:Muscle segmentation homeobox [Pseudolycoriella hygida]|uniref:Muscle segmentation homeobox n=1 Tax=Pseudolycoriella hygida TaxID=35572 RepID=A0A9Q0RZ08_9DIPT|nr:Muscle segmentation homeobox [Pseudolycoriella hygida]
MEVNNGLTIADYKDGLKEWKALQQQQTQPETPSLQRQWTIITTERLVNQLNFERDIDIARFLAFQSESDIMTVTAVRTAMTSPTVPPQQKISRISNFSVASLLADTRQKSPQSSDIPTNLSQSSSSPISHHDSNSIAKNERHTPHSSTESEVDYDSNQEDSIVDIEDIHNENCSTPGLDKSSHMLSSPTLGGHVPIRPTPFSALAAAAAAWGGIGAGMPWAGSRQMTPFGPSGLFPGQGFGPGHVPGGKVESITETNTLFPEGNKSQSNPETVG